jgi:hypothetical protein
MNEGKFWYREIATDLFVVDTDILTGTRERVGTLVRHKIREGYIWEAFTNVPNRRPIGTAHTRKAASTLLTAK